MPPPWGQALVYASSRSVCGAKTIMPFSVHHNVDHPVSLYAATKKANELMAPYLFQGKVNCDLLKCWNKSLGRTATKNLLPIQAGDVPATFADVDDLMQDVGFRPATSIEDGIRRFVDWYRTYFNIE